MKQNEKISPAVIRRLPRYLRALEDLENSNTERISSGELSALIGYTASQIRQDLNHFGGFGQQGYGYNVKDLKAEIEKILGLGRQYKMVIVGAGRLGQAINSFISSYSDDFCVTSLFDVKEELIGKEKHGVLIRAVDDLTAYLKENPTDIGVITVTKENAQSACDALVAGGVSGIWNFAPIDLERPAGIPMENVHLSDNLHSLVYYINHPEQI
ncbi:MAG: redox-sensing transcriptional repressor Rex [Firmicutes bacterium]|nr:redox-sensing transcriptional repressor Rex [Bacillota bacterium]